MANEERRNEGEIVGLNTRPLEFEDAPSCDAIVLTHPDFFGHEGGRAECARAVRSQGGWVAEDGGQVVGFATWERRNDFTAEVTWMAVLRERRHTGIGMGIIEALAADLHSRGFRLALALTSAAAKDADVPDTYAPTRRFWLARGFVPLIELDIWDTNFALLQVRPLHP